MAYNTVPPRVPNPLYAIIDWLTAQAPEVREYLCLMLKTFSGQAWPDDPKHICGTYLQALRDSTSGLADVGRIVQLRALLDFELVKRAKPSSSEFYQSLIDAPGVSETIKDTLQRTLTEAPLRDRRWKQVYAEWRQLRATLLTDEMIEAFIEETMLLDAS